MKIFRLVAWDEPQEEGDGWSVREIYEVELENPFRKDGKLYAWAVKIMHNFTMTSCTEGACWVLEEAVR